MRNTTQYIGLVLGPLCFFLVLIFFHPKGLSAEANAILASTIWIAIWWITEAINIAVTALLPIVLFPVTGGLNLNETTASYGHKYIFLFVGGFILAIAIEKWNLHRRIALNIIKIVGTNKANIILGFMIATAFMSMWISNTATAVMILPIGMAIVTQLYDNPETVENEKLVFGKALMLAIAYSASIGGMATLIGTPPNLVLAGVVQKSMGIEITFAKWFAFGFPLSFILLIICWIYLTKSAFNFKQEKTPGGAQEIQRQLSALGKITNEEKTVLMVFVLAAFAWISRSLIIERFIPSIDDTIIAIFCSVLLFLLPAHNNGKILYWEDAVKLPWGILLLYGGGMALALGFQSSGLAAWIGQQLISLQAIPFLVLLLILIASVNFLTEVTSNLATTAMLLPVLVSLAPVLNIDPFYLMIGATAAASCAFMLPVATPPNAIVFGSGYLKIQDMVEKGVWMNLISILILTIVVYFLVPLVWDLK